MFEFLRKKARPQPASDAAPATVAPVDRPSPPPPLAAAVNAFGLDLWSRVAGASGNVVVSPGSLWLALAMTTSGAGSETRAELTRVLRWSAEAADLEAAIGRQLAAWTTEDADRGLTLRVVNRLFGDNRSPFEAAWLRRVDGLYGAPLERLAIGDDPEGARAHVNAWVQAQTAQRIRDLLPSGAIDRLTRLVLVNAVYFLGRWAAAFDESVTTAQPFHEAPGRAHQVPMMRQFAGLQYADVEGAQVLSLAYEGAPVSMLVVLPTARDGLAALEARLTPARVEGWVAALRDTVVDLALPRFTIEPQASLALGEVLKAMGVTLAFDRERADFTPMANPPLPDERLVVSNVFHRAFIKVDEAGTEAAAATAVVMAEAGAAPDASPPPPRLFRADHPFLFFLRDLETGVWLFQGRVSTP